MISIKRVLGDGTELFISGEDLADFGRQLEDLDIPGPDQDRIFDLFEQFAETGETVIDSRPRQLGEANPGLTVSYSTGPMTCG